MTRIRTSYQGKASQCVWRHTINMCRAFLSPWYEKGGMHPIDENDKPIFEGRCNLGVVSLHLPMILAKARKESKNFYEVLDYYLELIRGLHKRTYDYIGELHASVNPIAFCEGGLLGGNLKPDEKIKSILPPMTMSYGITALNELQRLYNGKSIREDGEFALEVMKYINDYTNRIKEEDHILYAIYGTPAESLCGLQVEQFRKIYGIVENVIKNMNIVLEQLVPGLRIGVVDLGSTMTKDGKIAKQIQLISLKNNKQIPFCYESEGIKKIVSNLQLLIVVYNNPSVTVAIDELDSGVFEYLLGEMLNIISEKGKGQLIFTSHNLRPLETIDKGFIAFTTTNQKNRYIRLTNVKGTNNLRDFYYRDIVLGEQSEQVYNPTNNFEIALAFREAGEIEI